VERDLCRHCRQQPVVGCKRKYCDVCSPLASLFWKRVHRRLWKAAGDQYWLTDWKHKTPDERRAYFRVYMRAYRQRQQNREAPAMGFAANGPHTHQRRDSR
jgi:hypothetical protein